MASAVSRGVTHERARYSRNHDDLPTLEIRYNEGIQRWFIGEGGGERVGTEPRARFKDYIQIYYVRERGEK